MTPNKQFSEQRAVAYILLIVCYLLIGVSLFMVWQKTHLG